MHLRMYKNDFDILLRSVLYSAKLNVAKIHKNAQYQSFFRLFVVVVFGDDSDSSSDSDSDEDNDDRDAATTTTPITGIQIS